MFLFTIVIQSFGISSRCNLPLKWLDDAPDTLPSTAYWEGLRSLHVEHTYLLYVVCCCHHLQFLGCNGGSVLSCVNMSGCLTSKASLVWKLWSFYTKWHSEDQEHKVGLAPSVWGMALLEKQLVQNKQVLEEKKDARSLSKCKAVGMGPAETSPTQIPQNLLCFQQNLGHLLLTRSPEHWTKQEGYVPMNVRYFRYSYCWNNTRGTPLSSGFIPSEACFQHCVIYWTLVKNGNSPGSRWYQEWAGGKDFFLLRRWFCTRDSEQESSARVSIESTRGKGKSGCRPWPREQLLLKMDLSGLRWRDVFWNKSPGICSSVFSLPLYLLCGWLFGVFWGWYEKIAYWTNTI